MMPFMQRQVTSALKWYEIDTSHGIEFLEFSYIGQVQDKAELQKYIEAPEIYSFEIITGMGARLSAPGYLDCTPWTVFDSEEKAIEYLDEYYPENED